MKRLPSLLFVSLSFLASSSWAQTPESAKEFVKSCSSLYERKNWDGAIAACSKAIELDPRAGDAYVMRGIVLHQGKANLDGAIADFSKALEIDPHSMLLYRLRGVVRVTKGDWDGALADYNKLIEKEPSGDHYYVRGMARLAKGDLDEAIKDFGVAIEKSHTSSEVYRLRAEARFRKKDWDGAIADNSVAIARDPKYPDAYASRGLARVAKGKDAEAQNDFEKFLALAPGLEAVLEEKIKEARRERGQESRAVPTPSLPAPSTTAVESDPNAWKEYSSAQGRFKIMFPGTPTDSDNSYDTPLGRFDSRTYILRTSAEYMVVYTDFVEPELETDPELNKILDQVRDDALAASKNKLLSDTAISLDGHPGRMIKTISPDGIMTTIKIYVVGERLYQIAVTTPKEVQASDASRFNESRAAKFLDSFKLAKAKDGARMKQ